MKEFERSLSFRGRDITARALFLSGGLQVSLFGGDRPHIGAVGVASPEGEVSVTEFPRHREGVLCEKWARVLADAGFLPAVVTAGIHYDGLEREGIRKVLMIADELLDELTGWLRQEDNLTNKEQR